MSLLLRYAATMRSLAFTAVLFGFAVFAHCAVRAQNHNSTVTNLTVIVLDGNTGKPIKGVHALSVISVEGRPKGLNQETNGNGVAVFHLTDSIPERFGFDFPVEEFGLCSDGMPFSTEQVLKTGIVSRNTCAGARFQYSAPPRPGEVVVFGKRVTLWQRILREIP
jgi:hypothetical protein